MRAASPARHDPPMFGNAPIDRDFTVVYSRWEGLQRIAVTVRASDEDTAIMRAGMARAEMYRLERSLFPNLARERWVRESVTAT